MNHISPKFDPPKYDTQVILLGMYQHCLSQICVLATKYAIYVQTIRYRQHMIISHTGKASVLSFLNVYFSSESIQVCYT